MASLARADGRVDAGPRRIFLCADDYGISPSVDTAIRDLIVRGRLNATSVMVVAPSFQRSESISLGILNSGRKRVAIGLHVTLTAPFAPLTKDFRPLEAGAFLPLPALLRASVLRRLSPEHVAAEVAAQMGAFAAAFGQPPDFVDGHQHAHLFPQIRDAVFGAVKQAAPHAWIRQCGRALPFYKRVADPKGVLLQTLSRSFVHGAQEHGLVTNPGFAGTYTFRDDANFAALFPSFLAALPARSVVMCHPGHVDAELERLDPLTTLREREYAYLIGDQFPRDLAAKGVALAEFA